MWTPATRRQHSRDDCVMERPDGCGVGDFLSCYRLGQHGADREGSMREIMRRHLLRAALWLRLWIVPKCFPPATTVYGWFLGFRREGISRPSIIISSCAIAKSAGRRARRRL